MNTNMIAKHMLHWHTHSHTHTWTSRIDLMRVHQNIYRVYQRLTHLLATPLKQPLMPDTPSTISLPNEFTSSGCVQGVPAANPPPSKPVSPTHSVRCTPNYHPFTCLIIEIDSPLINEFEFHMITDSTLMIFHNFNDYSSSMKTQLPELTSESNTTTWFGIYIGCTSG